MFVRNGKAKRAPSHPPPSPVRTAGVNSSTLVLVRRENGRGDRGGMSAGTPHAPAIEHRHSIQVIIVQYMMAAGYLRLSYPSARSPTWTVQYEESYFYTLLLVSRRRCTILSACWWVLRMSLIQRFIFHSRETNTLLH